MSKSLKNTISIHDFLQLFSANELRIFCLLSPYRSSKSFSRIVLFLLSWKYRETETMIQDRICVELTVSKNSFKISFFPYFVCRYGVH
jgi:cysteinyl-tRNA synthetase